MSDPLFDIRGRVAPVSGANAGIGLGYAEAIASQGGDVVIWGRRADRNEEARERRGPLPHRRPDHRRRRGDGEPLPPGV